MKIKDFFYIAIAMLLCMPAIILIFGESEQYTGLSNFLGLFYAFMIYKLSYTKIGIKLVKSVLKMNIYIK